LRFFEGERNMKSYVFAAVLTLGATACAAGTEEEAASTSDLRTEGVTKITVHASPGFVAPAPIGACVFRGGAFEVDFVAKKVKGEACLEGGRAVAADRAMTAAEVARVRAALRGVKPTRAPQACPSDIGGTFLVLSRGGRESRFADPTIACSGSAQAAEGLAPLFDAVARLGMRTEQTVQGKLTTVFAIGGETTGMGIETGKGMVEFELPADHPAVASFVPGREAIMVGPMVPRAGVEIPSREVLVVTDILVCPASSAVLNCQPPANGQACATGNRFWIQSNCEGVTFLD